MTLLNVEDPRAWDRVRRLNALAKPFTAKSDPAEISAWVHACYVRSDRDDLLRAAIEQTMRRNGGSKRQWLAVNGPANMGKSEMVLQFALAFDAAERERLGDRESDYAHVPVIYVQADPKLQGAGLLRAVSDFAGVPAVGNEDQLRRRLMSLFPLLDTHVVFIDDSHMFHGGAGRADSIRATIRLPATFVFVGAGLEKSAMLSTDGADGDESVWQLQSRHTWLGLDPLRMPEDLNSYRRLIGDYLRRLRKMVPHLATPFQSDNECLGDLIRRTGGRVGAVMGALKDATVEAAHTDCVVRPELVLQFADAPLGVPA